MLDFGWTELLLVIAIAVFVTDPKDIPKLLYNAGRMVRKARYMRFAINNQLESLMKEYEFEELKSAPNRPDFKDEGYNPVFEDHKEEYDDSEEEEFLNQIAENDTKP